MRTKLSLLSIPVLALAATTAGSQYWSADQLRARSEALAGKMNQRKVAVETIGSWGNHSLTIVHREANGEVEIHTRKVDVTFVEDGDGAIITGGRVPDERTTTPGEKRGSRIVGGEKKLLHPGDVIHIAAGTPHQILVAPGHKIDYYTVKIDSK